MPINQASTFGLLQAGFAASGIVGAFSVPLASAISSGFVQYITTAAFVTTIDVGVVGSGSGTGASIPVTPAALQGGLTASFAAQGVAGIMNQALINGISQAISQALLSAVITTAHVGVGIGTGTAIIVPNSLASAPIMISSFVSSAIAGVMSSAMATAIAIGIDTALLSAVTQVVISGAGGPSPSTGTGTGIIS